MAALFFQRPLPWVETVKLLISKTTTSWSEIKLGIVFSERGVIRPHA